jgi:hypothetical protein
MCDRHQRKGDTNRVYSGRFVPDFAAMSASSTTSDNRERGGSGIGIADVHRRTCKIALRLLQCPPVRAISVLVLFSIPPLWPGLQS